MKLELPYPPRVNTLHGVRAVIKRDELLSVLGQLSGGRINVHEAATQCQRLARAFPFKTREHEDYAKHARLAMYEQGYRAEQLPVHPKPAEVALKVRLFRPRRAGDIDGPLKTLLDALQGNLYENDDQLVGLEVHRDDDKERPRVELEVTELATNQTAKQEVLFDDQEAGHAAPPVKAGAGSAVASHRQPMPEPLERRLRRLATSATISHRSDDEPPF